MDPHFAYDLLCQVLDMHITAFQRDVARLFVDRLRTLVAKLVQ
jgi:hypothetical protein